MEFIEDSFQGLQREANKDSTFILEKEGYHLYFLFDGVSSAHGAVEAITQIKVFIQKNISVYEKSEHFLLKELIEDLNIMLLRSKLNEPFTTICVLYVPFSKNAFLQYTHLGDSRLYGVKQNLVSLTQDNNIERMPNVLTKCLGLKKLETGDFYEKNIAQEYDSYLLCSDGFYNIMEKKRSLFLQILNKDLNLLKKEIARLIFNQNSDDATYILIKVKLVASTN